MSKRKNTEKYYKIIDAATKIFAKKGFHQARISEIAREAQIADGTIYIYFENKDDILISLFEEQMNAVLDNMVEKISEQNNPIKKLEKFALTHLQLIEQNKNLAEIIQVEIRQSSKFMKEYKNEKFTQYLDLIGEIIQEGQEKGVFKKEVIPGVAKRAFFGALDEMSRFWVLSSRKRYDIKTSAKQISEYFLYGIIDSGVQLKVNK
ncbi:MAG: TetR/AcrR family transcriptional regulator [Deltaproteobacteria bacterium]|nr:TetR/AcrR family transcriptional regulator [Deltaproteobacteria bacterium]